MMDIIENPSNFEWNKFKGFHNSTNADYSAFGRGDV
jgi:hypothetical protein